MYVVNEIVIKSVYIHTTNQLSHSRSQLFEEELNLTDITVKLKNLCRVIFTKS